MASGDKILKDASGSIIGRIRETSPGRQQLIDRGGTVRGTFNEQTNQTKAKDNRVVGRSGNQLTRLL